MLSAASRAALRRLGSNVTAKSSRALVTSRSAAPASQWTARNTIQVARRDFATAGRPKASTRATTKKTTATKKATKKPAAKKTAAKKTTKKPKAVKSKAKKKVAAKPKKTKVKREKDPEKAAIEKRRELKRKALFEEPKGAATTAWNLYVLENTKGQSNVVEATGSTLKALAEKYKNLPAAELQRLANQCDENKRANAAKYKAWVEKYSVEDINQANNARYALKRTYNYPKGQIKIIKDERMPKRPSASYVFFTKARWASGELERTAGGLAAAGLGAEWKRLSAADRQPYEDLARADRQRYEKEMNALGFTVKPKPEAA